MEGRWGVEEARKRARVDMSSLGERWLHVQRVGSKAEALVGAGVAPGVVAVAAWLHDVGYVDAVAVTAFHPLDGARYLARLGVPPEVTSLVAHHSGAEVEAEERGLSAELGAFPRPAQRDLDTLTLIDMTTGPAGADVREADRIAEILRRYDKDHPVHRAVTRSELQLIQACERARAAMGFVDVSRRTG